MELQLLAIICVNLESNRLTGTALLSLLSGIYTAVNLMLHSLHYLMLRLHLIWWILKSCYNVLRLPSAFLALLFIGFARTFLITLRWWYLVTCTRSSWFLSNLASFRALFWALSSASYSQLIFLVYLLNTLSLATFMLMTSRFVFMVLLLNSLILYI